MSKINIKKFILAWAVGLYAFYYAATPQGWHFIDSVDLLIHEAGHVVFSIFGQFMYVLGGSLLQILLPLLFALYFFFQRQKFSGSLLLYWVGFNVLNVSIYAADAVRMQLPLLTGDTSGHDWNYLLLRLGWLHNTQTVGNILFYTGILVLLIAFGLSLWNSKEEEKILMNN